jgi:hypothetical protein
VHDLLHLRIDRCVRGEAWCREISSRAVESVSVSEAHPIPSILLMRVKGPVWGVQEGLGAGTAESRSSGKIATMPQMP